MTACVPKRIEAIEAFLGQLRSLVEKNRAAEVECMAGFFADYKCWLANLQSTARFNVLDITGVGNDEVKHSSILAWLLAPNAAHGCGTCFLQLFLRAVGINISDEHLPDCYVRTEFSGNESIVDILVCKPGEFLVYVENKTLSAEGVNQVDREYRDMLRVGTSVRVPISNMFPVFLTPGGRPPTSGDPRPWHPLSYRTLALAFETALPMLGHRKIAFLVEDLVEQYQRWSNV